jgi:outer membrane protein assembly factor BamD (BamD/ComL family)
MFVLGSICRWPRPARLGGALLAGWLGAVQAIASPSPASAPHGSATAATPSHPTPAAAGRLPAPATNTPADGTRPLPFPVPNGTYGALLDSARLVTNSNLLPTPPTANGALPQYALLLGVARQQRLQQNYTGASRYYASVLECPAPSEYHRTAMLELALMNQEHNESAKALQIFSQYLKTWPEDPATPEIMLRQGLVYRQMGVPTMALAKFYSVMTSALTLKYGSLEYYQRLVLHAQAEIADTYYLQGQYADASEFFKRLLKQDSAELNRQQIHLKLVRCTALIEHDRETIVQANEYLQKYPRTPETAEVRFLLAKALKQLKRNDEALQQVLLLLKSQQASLADNPTNWVYWQLRAGNEIGNRLYLEGDYFSALDIYSTLATLNPTPAWQLPVWYQVGLVYERLEQPAKAAETYGRIVDREKELSSGAAPGLKTVVDMARWRSNYLNWQTQAERTSHTNYQALAIRPIPASP